MFCVSWGGDQIVLGGLYGVINKKGIFAYFTVVCHIKPMLPYYTPAPSKVEWGYTWFTPMSVSPSVRPSVCRQGFRNFLKKLLAQFISYLAFCPYRVSLLTPIHFRVPSLIFGPLVAKYLAKNGVWKNYWPNSFHTWHLPLWGESLDPYTFPCS